MANPAVASRPAWSPRVVAAWTFAAVALLAALLWAYWPVLRSLLRDWRGDDDYSSGQLVPFAAFYLLWVDRHALARLRPSPCGWGAAVILVAQAVRGYGVLFMFESAERYSFVLTIMGVVLLVAGRRVFRRGFWVLLFLFLMVPLPGRVHNRVSGPLQGLATSAAVFLLDLAGISVVREGHTVILNDSIPLAVAEACSGLRMLTAFVMVAWVFAGVIHRPRWQKAVLVLSSVPVAIVCNLIRIIVTVVLVLLFGSGVAERYFHDFAGWTMMPMAILMLVAELWLMGRLVVEEDRERVQAAV